MRKIKIFNSVPKEISLSPEEFLRYLNTTSVIKVEPQQKTSSKPIVIGCLMHGNEPSGFYAVHEFLQNRAKQQKLQRTIYFLFLNPKAALTPPIFSTRHTDDESDMNRIWHDAGINIEQN